MAFILEYHVPLPFHDFLVSFSLFFVLSSKPDLVYTERNSKTIPHEYANHETLPVFIRTKTVNHLRPSGAETTTLLCGTGLGTLCGCEFRPGDANANENLLLRCSPIEDRARTNMTTTSQGRGGRVARWIHSQNRQTVHGVEKVGR